MQGSGWVGKDSNPGSQMLGFRPRSLDLGYSEHDGPLLVTNCMTPPNIQGYKMGP